MKRVKYHVFMSSCGVSNPRSMDRDYIVRMATLLRHTPTATSFRIRAFVLAMDHWYDEDGTKRMDKTGMYVPNEYVYSLAKEFPKCFAPCVSVHPYRPDALQEVAKWGKRGIRFMKWLPNSQGIDPSHSKCTPFYKKLKKYDIVLLSHTGQEHSVDAGYTNQFYGNPLLLRKPLDMGVKIVAAHCGSRGTVKDLDDPSARTIECFDAFLRLMDEEQYKDVLFADIAAMTSFKRVGRPLMVLLERQDLHHRLIHGSDYPLPAINILVRTGKLKRMGYITRDQKRLLNEIYNHNPLLFDFVTKRTIRHPKTGKGFNKCIFMKNTKLAHIYSFSEKIVRREIRKVEKRTSKEVKQDSEAKEIAELELQEGLEDRQALEADKARELVEVGLMLVKKYCEEGEESVQLWVENQDWDVKFLAAASKSLVTCADILQKKRTTIVAEKKSKRKKSKPSDGSSSSVSPKSSKSKKHATPVKEKKNL
eukprot:TRINITY_DN1268_c0_g1_i1.p1 TRINITY_DN1268_c0_g1~~TRINITY_DN1268_c0_g1_i1.p1  ORF type:complete len:544 (-),score=83.57 TRINITY_DN1268_c0_g1_i1:58-1488(-)